ncbi:methyl-accepting chemotaxis protein [Hydrogenovibrio sp. 3SP14C1]|uniref:methyl-accepting chemotaxis protein n=1 Tax=Hydrogenovibrio sp. 3SP14C1 TaxID=3038774 RepID=UPI0024167884|nr:methyl-accepting chemotaxis protein [Hydrogenovibrio sp. 3SP14C1]MDG4811438.1 methyl-accepting chemotaxis protein [Hydrogenovibrio sp. 3SP14C1]
MFKTIRAKLLGSFILVAILVIFMSIFSVSKIFDSADGFKDYRGMARDSVLAGEVQSNMLMVRMNVKDYLVNPVEKEVNEFNGYFDKTAELIQAAQKEIKNPERAKLVDQLEEGLTTYHAKFESVQNLMSQRNDIVFNNLNKNGKIMEHLLTSVQRSAYQDQDFEAAFKASESLRTLLLARIYAIKFIESNQASDMDRTLSEFDHLNEQVIELEASIQNPTRIEQLGQAKQLITEYQSGVNELNQAISNRNQIVENDLNVIGPKIANWAEDVKLSIKKDQDRIGPEVKALNDSIISAMIIISIIITALSTIIAIFIPRSIARGISGIQNTLSKVSDTGDFSIRADEKRQDEIGEMGRSVNFLLSNMQEAIIEANKVVVALSKGQFDQRVTADLNGDLNTLKEGINDSADSIDETMKELGRVMESMNNGDFNITVNADVEGDFLRMVNNVSATMKALNSSISDIINVMDAMQQGQFNKRVEAEAKGDLLTLKEGINTSMTALDSAIEDVTRVVVAQSEGDLTQNITADYYGELKTLKNAINSSAAKLTDVVTKAINATNIVNSGATEVAQGSMDLSQRVQEQAAALEETSSTMEEMNSAVQNNAEHAKQATDVAHDVQQKSTEGSSVMQQTIEAMNAIQESSHKISEIVTLIDGIAFQTNLLALNAAVEAARAGDHGRGFAVVAGEVRALAQKSADAAKDITNLINESVTRIDQGTKLASESGEVLSTINQSIDNVAQMIEHIAQASVQQTEGIEQAHKAISQIDEVTQQNAALVEETSAAAESMSEQAGILEKDMAFFKTGNVAQISHTKPAQQSQTSPAALPSPKQEKPNEKQKEAAPAQKQEPIKSPNNPAPQPIKEEEWSEF